MFLFKVIFYKYFQHSIAGKQVGNSQINWCPLRKVAKKHGIKGVKTLHATLLDVAM